MAVNQKPIFPIIGNSVGVIINAANTAADGSGTIGTNLFLLINSDAVKSGTVIKAVVFTSSQSVVGASVAKVCRIYMSDAAGVNAGIVGEIVLPDATRSNTAIGPTATFYFPVPFSLQPGQKIYVSQSVRATSADDTYAYPIAGDYSL